MSTLDLNDYQVVLNAVKTDLAGFTHETVDVTWTATMKNGSIVNASGVEIAAAAYATAAGVIDDLTARNLDGAVGTGDTISVSVAKRGCVFNDAVVTYTDGLIDANGKAVFAGNMNTFSTVA